MIAAGAAAHAGKGRYGSRIPKDQGNDFLFGVEVEGTTGLTWSNDQLESAARLGHAMNKEWGSSFLQIGHLEYAPGRKIDPSGIPGGMSALRKAIARGYWTNKNWKPGGKVTTGSAASKPKPAAKPASSGKSVATMASEVIAGLHGSGHANRQRSLGVDNATYQKVRGEVNRLAGVSTLKVSSGSSSKSISQMATEVINGQHGTGHENRRRSLKINGSTYDRVRAEVNRRAGGSSSSGGGKSLSQMATEVIQGKHGNGHAQRQRSLGVNNATYAAVRKEVNRRS